ncbi:thiamine pyrophosphate-binding protein [Cellvibrio japonicus]|uniref:Putative acetolactate synthase large subunit n=1 Tax=Cellvibrio japonicus (strain Ueda107) TaxID=498211 RepID=B3PK97_CELJU|nr:thiamine pyrophosphate-binding protein [Cellvibrio japonicus]ACE86330.1 putative acetolactate synthase large subunit [Cellvibrio japonicus Ueda107]QEI11414.1 thiamine pyrophosphate-binding protein [Cellvibrio japonicus]QEI14988.1 thiamine pyrophosphate-binding protein [Cellvibrio japonicus]QEI18568.1 thiamine pyrophosphate-binding protein [Cellvibrio japonicus]
MREIVNTYQQDTQVPTTDCADVLIDYLDKLGVETIFGVPGGAIEPLFNALARSARRGGPRLITARHECGAAFMADGYYRETGKMGVVCSTTGPGATNLVTGVASALTEEIPILLITAQTPLPKFGRRALQDSSCSAIDTVSIFRQITLYSSLVSHHEQLENKLVTAVMTAHRQPGGPVHLSIPSDILRQPMALNHHIQPELLTHDFAIADDGAIAQLGYQLTQARRLVVYVGKSARYAGIRLMEFIEQTGAAFVCGPMGKAWVDEFHPQFRGVYGFAGHLSARGVLQHPEVDLIIAVGAALDELETRGWSNELLNHKLVHIDSTIEHFTRSPMARLHIYGRLDVIFDRLLVMLRHANRQGKLWDKMPVPEPTNVNGSFIHLDHTDECLSPASPIKPQRLMHWLTRKLPDHARIFVDAGNSWAWSTHYLSTRSNQGYYRIAMSFGSMTWAMSAAIGSSIANPDAPTVCILGDGAYLMGAQEISVAAQHGLSIVFILLNDAAMGMVMHGQRLGKQESIGWQLNPINYAALVQAMGIHSQVIREPSQLEQLDLDSLFRRGGPSLLDVRIDRETVPPMGDRIRGLMDNSATPGG